MIQRQAIDIESAEKSLIGSAINKPRLIPKLGSMVRPQHFAGPQLGQFWAVVSDFSLAEKPMDVVTLLEPAKRIWGDNAASILGELITFVPHADHADYYAKLVVDGFRIRNYGRIAAGLHDRTEDLSESPGSIEAWLQDQLDDQLGTSSAKSVTAHSAGIELLNNMESDRGRATVQTGIHQIDREVCGFAPGELVVLAGRPGNCKTAFALQIAEHAAHSNQRTLFVSLEMTSAELMTRILCGQCGIDGRRLRNCSLTQDDKRRLFEANEAMADVPLFVQDTHKVDIQQLNALGRIQADSTGLDLIVVDYIGLIDPGASKADRREQVAVWSRSLKLMAKELGVPVLVLVQLNRATDSQPVPRLSNLAESGAIEQDADIVMFLHRQNPSENAFQLLIAKHRHADLGHHSLYLNVETMKLQIDDIGLA